MSKEAMKQALEALERVKIEFSIHQMDTAITALREALAEQPTHTLALNAAMGYIMRHTPKLVHDEICKALRSPAMSAAPQPAQPSEPLTKDQIAKFYGGDSQIVFQIIRDTEAAHGIKENT